MQKSPGSRALWRSGLFSLCAGALLSLVLLRFLSQLDQPGLIPEDLRRSGAALALQILSISAAAIGFVTYTSLRTRSSLEQALAALTESCRIFRSAARAAGAMVFCRKAPGRELISPQSREEIAALTWDQVQFEDNALTLPDRTVPLAPSAEDCLRERYRLYAQRDPHVIISDRYQRPMPPESVSRLARTALDTEGQKVSLKDLRQDFVIRQLQTHDWTYAARVSGMAVSTLRGSFSQYFQERQSAAPELPPDSEYLLWRIVQQEGGSVVGLALWMGWKLQMQPGEILNLTWSQVDLDRGLLRLPDREIPMGSRLSRLLGDVCDHRKDPAQDRVLLTPGTGKPMDLARLSTVIRTALIRGGLEQLSLGDLSRLSRRGSQRQTVLARLSAVGSLTREEVMDLLGISKSAALKLLNQLRQDGAVVRIGGCYYPAGAVVLPEDQSAAVTAYLAAHGTAVRKELAELLNLPPAQCTALLRRMADRGELLLTGKRYALPPQKKPLETN